MPADTSLASTSLAGNLASTALALCFVLALAWVLLHGLKRWQGRRPGTADDAGLPRVLRSVPLGPRERLVTVQYRGRDYLLGVASGAITLLDAGPGADPSQLAKGDSRA